MDTTTASIDSLIEESTINLIVTLPFFLEMYWVNASVTSGRVTPRSSIDEEKEKPIDILAMFLYSG